MLVEEVVRVTPVTNAEVVKPLLLVVVSTPGEVELMNSLLLRL